MEKNEHARTWRLLVRLMIASGATVLVAAYGISHDTALQLTTGAIEATKSEFLDSLLARFSSYASPPNALIAVLTSWLTSPLSLFAGYLFTGIIIKENIIINAPSNRVLLSMRVLLVLALSIVSLYAVAILPGLSSVFCNECEQNSMMFMLIVCVVGFWCVGALFGTVATLLKTISTNESVQK